MKNFRPKYIIVAIAAFCLGFMGPSLMGITMRRAANSRFISESEQTLKGLRAQVAKFRKKEGHFPSGPAELYAKGYLDPSNPPVESMRRGAQWLPAWDGESGFVYLSATGQVYLNADVSREKFFRADWKRVLEGGLFPPGKIVNDPS